MIYRILLIICGLLAILFSSVANAQYKYNPQTKKELIEAVKTEMAVQGDSADLNCINTSAITDMSYLFAYGKFIGDISKWNVSKVTNMRGIFENSPFNNDISKWDVSSVTDMSRMFYEAKFDGDISQWSVSKVTDMTEMFFYSKFKGVLSNWNVSEAIYTERMFDYCTCPTPSWYIKDLETSSIRKVQPDEMFVKWSASRDTVPLGDSVMIECSIYYVPNIKINTIIMWDKGVPDDCDVDTLLPSALNDVVIGAKKYRRESINRLVIRPTSSGVVSIGGGSMTFDLRQRDITDQDITFIDFFPEVPHFEYKVEVQGDSFFVEGKADISNVKQEVKDEVFLFLDKSYEMRQKDFSTTRQKAAASFAKKLYKETKGDTYASYGEGHVSIEHFSIVGKAKMRRTTGGDPCIGDKLKELLNTADLSKTRDLVILASSFYDWEYPFASAIDMCRSQGIRVCYIYLNSNEVGDDDVVSQREYDKILRSVESTGGMFVHVKNRQELMDLLPQVKALTSSGIPRKVKFKYYPQTKEELETAIKTEIAIQGPSANLNCISTSAISDMSDLFSWSNFNGDISEWNVSNVTHMNGMFKECYFNGDISKWDVSNVVEMSAMFNRSKFNGDISKWDVSNVEYMGSMFSWSDFNGDISKWDVSNVREMGSMFWVCPCDIPSWYK